VKESAIKHKLRQVIFRHRKRFIADHLRRRPSNCSFNGQCRTPGRDRKAVGVCLFQVRVPGEPDDPEKRWNNVICDENQAGIDQAQGCPHFEARFEAGDLKQMFDTIIGLDGTPVNAAQMSRDYPDIMALTWVLGGKVKPGTPVAEIFEGEDELKEVSDE
jgi:hypothetical protein